MLFEIHESNEFTAFFDPVKSLLYIQYQEEITPQITNHVYTWINSVLEKTPSLLGTVFDFQLVKRFDQSNHSTAQRHSVQLNTKFDLSTIPTILLVKSVYQEMTMRTQLRMSPQQERKKLVKNLNDGLDFMAAFNEARDIEPLEIGETALSTNGVSMWYDEPQCTVTVLYYGTVTGDTTAAVYETTNAILAKYGVETVRGGLYDFRCVAGFQLDNYRTVRSESSTLNQAYDMSHIAVSLVVQNIVQERLVRSTLRVTTQEPRKKVVYSIAEARDFIETFEP